MMHRARKLPLVFQLATVLLLASLLARDLTAKEKDKAPPAINPLAPKPPHFAPKAKAVIFLFMVGGPSHIETFDPKPNAPDQRRRAAPAATFGS